MGERRRRRPRGIVASHEGGFDARWNPRPRPCVFATMRVLAILAIAMLAAVLGGCGSTPAGSIGSTPAVSSSPPQQWWVVGTGSSGCGHAAWYRLAGQVHPAGDCAANLDDPAVDVTMRVGEQLDIHMTEDESATSRGLVPLYAVPTSSNSAVLQRVSVGQDATASYRAVAPGTAKLLTPDSACTDAATGRQSSRPCPVVEVTVRPG